MGLMISICMLQSMIDDRYARCKCMIDMQYGMDDNMVLLARNEIASTLR